LVFLPLSHESINAAVFKDIRPKAIPV